ncbi:phytoene/squalene synthase family protein [Streptomyces sp. AN091965]|uniref:phytoene/squalene synthase family protein n=1 Tax=Streptomyces sp. AN091965 TaxID=2927803 RepID=UPI001F60733B|nr:squalene/phytoene synthase family protein [Streptomyces sp. AN091965]MCI3928065.1 squalene/phytoene synthase family protein [Streptomyces sp. AN091965]
MSSWKATLDAAGIESPQLRADFTRLRRVVSRYRRHQYLAVRLLLPKPIVPHVIAATVFMHHTDTILDREGPVEERAAAFERWEELVRDALTAQRSDHPVLRPLLHTCGTHPRLEHHIKEFLDAGRVDLEFAGFTGEEDYQHYIDAYSLPAFMLVAGLLVPDPDEVGYRSACRRFIDGSQRLDFATDLAEDLRAGRLNIPAETLERHGVTRADLESQRDSAGVRSLLEELIRQARTSLAESHALVTCLPEAHRPMGRALIGMEELTADAARRKGAHLLSSSARASIPAALRLLAREYRRRS